MLLGSSFEIFPGYFLISKDSRIRKSGLDFIIPKSQYGIVSTIVPEFINNDYSLLHCIDFCLQFICPTHVIQYLIMTYKKV